MVDGWYTLRALAAEWDGKLAGAVVEDVHSASKDELSIVLALDGEADTLRISVSPADRYVFRQPGGARPRRNVTTLFESVLGREVVSIDIAHRDRVLDLSLAGGIRIRILLFGPRANVLLGREGTVEASFREKLARPGDAMPEPRAAPEVDGAAALADRWPGESQPLDRAVQRSYPLFDALMAAEVVHRAGLAVSDACLVNTPDFERLAAAATSVRKALEAPTPRIFRDGREPVAFSLIPLSQPPAPDEAAFDTVDGAVREFVRARLGHAAFLREFEPLQRTLETAAVRNRTRAERMLRELSEPSRSDRYERWGHLLMAARPETQGEDEVEVADLFEGGDPVRIPLDPALTAIENAERYYAKARQSRRSREEAELRMETVDRARRDAEMLLAELERIGDRRDLRAFRSDHADALARFARERGGDGETTPFRRFDLGHGYEAWVGRNAKENDALTFRHARGVSGSHVVLRCPRRAEKPPQRILEAAAAIAAWFSKASGSAMVPVIVSDRRFVRKPKGAPPGAVLVDREEVVIVEPRLPAGSDDG